MALDAADKAHKDKVEETADGERLVEHSTFTEGDRELRKIMDEAEVERVAAYQEGGYVGSPMAGDYHAVRRAAKQAGGLLAGIGGEGVADDPSAAVAEQIGDVMKEENKRAAAARRAAGQRRTAGPANRQSRDQVMQTGGLVQGAGEGVGKSASSTGTDTTDRGMDASVGKAPPSEDGEPQKSDQDRPASQGASTGGRTGGGRTSGTTKK
jgi:hypothetical protein